jgi:hypothetical protein
MQATWELLFSVSRRVQVNLIFSNKVHILFILCRVKCNRDFSNADRTVDIQLEIQEMSNVFTNTRQTFFFRILDIR